jgi:hypothetical protein
MHALNASIDFTMTDWARSNLQKQGHTSERTRVSAEALELAYFRPACSNFAESKRYSRSFWSISFQ